MGHGKRVLATAWAVYVLGAMAAGGAMQVVPGGALLAPVVIVARGGGHRGRAILARVDHRRLI